MTAVKPTDGARARPQDLTCKSGVSDADLELAIAAAMDRMCKAPERAEKMQHWREMCRLIDMRSVSQVRFMTRVRGLA